MASAKKLLVVGVGHMGASLVKGLLKSSHAGDWQISLCDIHEERLSAFAGTKSLKTFTDLSKVSAKEMDVVVFCVKPQDFATVAAKLAGKLSPKTLVISILAAVEIKDIAAHLKFGGAVVRTMPNIAATVGEAATAMCKNDSCTEDAMQLAHEIFSSVGIAVWTKESLMDTVTGLSGSGPAYIYMVIEALTDGGVKMGLPRLLASQLATQTVLGSATLVKETSTHPAILRDQVTTPGGTTIAAIHELEERGLRAMLMSAVATATEQSKKLRGH